MGTFVGFLVGSNTGRAVGVGTLKFGAGTRLGGAVGLDFGRAVGLEFCMEGRKLGDGDDGFVEG